MYTVLLIYIHLTDRMLKSPNRIAHVNQISHGLEPVRRPLKIKHLENRIFRQPEQKQTFTSPRPLLFSKLKATKYDNVLVKSQPSIVTHTIDYLDLFIYHQERLLHSVSRLPKTKYSQRLIDVFSVLKRALQLRENVDKLASFLIDSNVQYEHHDKYTLLVDKHNELLVCWMLDLLKENRYIGEGQDEIYKYTVWLRNLLREQQDFDLTLSKQDKNSIDRIWKESQKKLIQDDEFYQIE